MIKIGFVGWRGMVGSVLMQRMKEENDFNGFEDIYFSTSQVGQNGPKGEKLLDANSIGDLSKMDVIVTCQGGDYTKDIYPKIKQSGWKGYWIDAASALRMENDSIIILDPINLNVIKDGLKSGIKSYIGGNCTVSLMLMGIGGLFHHDLVEWISSMTYQAASGAGAKNMIELAAQMRAITNKVGKMLDDPAANALEIERLIATETRSESHPTSNFGAPLAASLIPWIDVCAADGQTKEEWKGFAETNKILRTKKPIPVDGICVRVGSMRCHSQGLTIKLKKDVPLNEIEDIIAKSNQWSKVIPNEKAITLKELTPSKISGTLTVPVGRIHKMKMGNDFLTCFTCGDQLLWGAAEPIRRMIKILVDYLAK
jgi:aspartate-semialdehyde dehydrogenase